MSEVYQMVKEAAEFLKAKYSQPVEHGIILGTGLDQLVRHIDVEVEIPYEEIPDFPVSTVEAHAGKMILGTLSGKRIMAMAGRFHFYEGYSMQQIAMPVRVMKLMGAQTLLVSNAAGGINPMFEPGAIMAITDHINLLGLNPLIGVNIDEMGPRFPDMSEPYSEELLKVVDQVALENRIRIEHGVYAAMSGPCLETRAEYRMLKTLGADAIGMSTVPEVIAAVHAGMKVLGLSVITDACLPDALKPVDIKEIIATANKAQPNLVKLIEKVLAKL